MADFNTYVGMSCSEFLAHYGKGHLDGGKSGRYPWGSGKNPKQRYGRQYIDEKDPVYRERKLFKNGKYNRKHFDTVISKGTVMSTLSRDKDRTKDTDMFYAAYTKDDINKYRASGFNDKVKEIVYDDDGNEIGSSKCYKFAIDNKANTDIKVASETRQEDAFLKLFRTNKDFSNFISSKDGLYSFFKDAQLYRTYKKGWKNLKKLQDPEYVPKESELRSIYKLFNYIIPNDGKGDAKIAREVKKQRARLFKELKKDGYGALLDVNDAFYWYGFRTDRPIIVFDMSQIVPDNVKRLTFKDKFAATMKLMGKGKII